MILKRFYGTTIQEALKSAKEKLGQDVMLIESVAPKDDKPASITVMLDEKLTSTQPVEKEEKKEEEFRNVFYKRSAVSKSAVNKENEPELFPNDVAVAESDSDRETSHDLAEPKNLIDEAKSEDKKEKKDTQKVALRKNSPKKTKQSQVEENRQLHDDEPMSRRSTPLIEIKSSPSNISSEGYLKESTVSREISAVQRRLEQLESMLSESLISASLDYASHGAFQQLLGTGIRATTISGWFKEIMQKGIDPFENQEVFMFELAKLVRKAISIDIAQETQPNLVFVGASGSGKTSLIMKLATHESFFKNKKIALVSVQPRNATHKYTILEPFARDHQIPYFTVQDGIDVSKTMVNLVKYDHVLFDTPSISLEKKTAFREYWKIRQILASVLPVEVHFVVNATMENMFFRETYATNHPLQPDYVALTHLDETNRWGHLIPFLKTLSVGVRYVTLGAELPDSVQAFSPTWFAEKVLSTANS